MIEDYKKGKKVKFELSSTSLENKSKSLNPTD
jgi:hypothetical protein